MLQACIACTITPQNKKEYLAKKSRLPLSLKHLTGDAEEVVHLRSPCVVPM